MPSPLQSPVPTALSPLEEILFKSWAKMHGIDDPDMVGDDLRGFYKATGGRGVPTPQTSETKPAESGPTITHELIKRAGEPASTKVTIKHPNADQESINRILELIHGGWNLGPDGITEMKTNPGLVPQHPILSDINLPKK